ncbi:hypothetical protein [Segeticoccus rhizosphaerae]|uniref:hypothetical protein n=1 Tax=Segeticoccus rhizosphaerae TaxID=1104777 RepID=UPI0010BFDE70|nr:hypothetical protein [Ornithinicoccus soli]
MPERHPGRIETPEDPTAELRIVKAIPPDLEKAPSRNWSGDEGKYTVHLQLSRSVTPYEKKAFEQVGKRMRVYGSTLEISNTTLEEIRDKTGELSRVVQQAEERGRAMQEEHEERARESKRERAEESDRLRKLSEEITFD